MKTPPEYVLMFSTVPTTGIPAAIFQTQHRVWFTFLTTVAQTSITKTDKGLYKPIVIWITDEHLSS